MKSNEQVTDILLMIRPSQFGYNAETAASNIFQTKHAGENEPIKKAAIQEFDELVKQLRGKNIYVLVLQDEENSKTPDAVFPNNWISFHHEKIILYPMLAENRRQERKPKWISLLQNIAGNKKIFDLSKEELIGNFLEGTGSLVLDRKNNIAFANISSRTNMSVLKKWNVEMKYKMELFSAQTNAGAEIYHTNVMLSIGETVSVICSAVIRNEVERNNVLAALALDRKVLEITEEQMMHFAGNMLLVKNRDGKNYWVMSKTAFNILSEEQKNTLNQDGDFLYSDLSTIETIGGGSARCMMAEVF